MKKSRLALVFVFSIALFLTSFVLGYRLMNSRLNPEDLAKVKSTNESIDREIEIVKEENRISPNTLVEERIHYKKCDHIITEANMADYEIINMTRKEYENYLKANYPNKRLISFSSTKIVIWGEREHLCKEHYIIGEENGYIAIFRIDDNGEKVLYKIFEDYPISILVEMDQEKIREGIIVDNEDELSDILENFIS
ncbi:MAG: BofC C-terminal domain-containing protein [Tissierellaceae bacterium]